MKTKTAVLLLIVLCGMCTIGVRSNVLPSDLCNYTCSNIDDVDRECGGVLCDGEITTTDTSQELLCSNECHVAVSDFSIDRCNRKGTQNDILKALDELDHFMQDTCLLQNSAMDSQPSIDEDINALNSLEEDLDSR